MPMHVAEAVCMTVGLVHVAGPVVMAMRCGLLGAGAKWHSLARQVNAPEVRQHRSVQRRRAIHLVTVGGALISRTSARVAYPYRIASSITRRPMLPVAPTTKTVVE